MKCGDFAVRDYDGLEHCTFCGSITVEKAMEILRTPGSHFSGADWKYGWPHKFYLDDTAGHHVKFYNNHLTELDGALLQEFSDLSERFFRISWDRNGEGKLMWRRT